MKRLVGIRSQELVNLERQHIDAKRGIVSAPIPEAIFESAARLLPEKPAEGLRSFLHRSTEDKSLGAKGYAASSDEDGFRYRRTW